jgi:G3E family GTPase
VIENEFGEVDIDGSLVALQASAEDDVLLLNTGCICCTVRGDLVRMLGELVRTKRDKFDHIVIETTGLANPAPIIQTFYLEPALMDACRLDGVVTLVDAKHVELHLDEQCAARAPSAQCSRASQRGRRCGERGAGADCVC